MMLGCMRNSKIFKHHLDWVKHMVGYGDKVIILDKKKFSFYDPDGCHYYCCDGDGAKCLLQQKIKRSFLMVWRVFSAPVQTE